MCSNSHGIFTAIIYSVYQLPIERYFEYIEKNDIFKFFKSLRVQIIRKSMDYSTHHKCQELPLVKPRTAVLGQAYTQKGCKCCLKFRKQKFNNPLLRNFEKHQFCLLGIMVFLCESFKFYLGNHSG